MKIKEVCKKTGLTEKSVRYYTECGLCTPGQSEIRGRVYSDYTQDNIRELRQVMCLRHAGLSIESIKSMKEGADIAGIMAEHTLALKEELDRKQEIYQLLCGIDYKSLSGVSALADALRPVNSDRLSPPDFSRFEDISVYGEDPDYATLKDDAWYQRGRRQALMISFILILTTMIAVMSVYGILMFLVSAFVFLKKRSGYLAFYRVIAFVGMAANIINALTVKNAASESSLPLASTPSGMWVYVIIAGVDLLALSALFFSKSLRDYLKL